MHVTIAPAPPRRSRAQTVIDNDRALREAIADVTLESGWDAVTFSGVAKRAGLTVGAVYGRADSLADLGADIWEADAGPWLRQVVAELLAAGRSGSRERVDAAYRAWLADAKMSALVVELVMASLFDADLGEVVLKDAFDILGPYCTPGPEASPHQAAAGSLLLSFAFGRALVTRGGASAPPIDSHQIGVLATCFGVPPQETPGHHPPRLVWRRSLDDLGPQTAAILGSTLDVIGRVGFKRATISRIARAGKVPRGSVLGHYDSKVALVADAAHRGLVTPMDVWLQYAPVIQAYGPLVSRAMFLRDFLAPDNSAHWAINLELARLAQLESSLREFRASDNVLEHTHLGVMLLATIVPGLDRLPFAGPFTAGTAT